MIHDIDIESVPFRLRLSNNDQHAFKREKVYAAQVNFAFQHELKAALDTE